MVQRGRATPNRVYCSAGGEKCSCQIENRFSSFFSWMSFRPCFLITCIALNYYLAAPASLLSILDVVPH